MNIYQSRWNNALAKANKINMLIAKGYILYNSYGEQVFEACITETKMYLVVNDCRVVLFECHIGLDHGMHTSITEFNKQFKGWTAAKMVKNFKL